MSSTRETRERASAAALALGLALSGASCGRSSESAALPTAEVSNLGLQATRVELADGLLVIAGAEDGVDLNGDGDGVDSILRIREVLTGRETLVADASSFSLGAGFVAFLVEESGRTADLNADGDQLDRVLFVYDARDRSVTGLGWAAAAPPAQAGALLAFTVAESEQGALDLDGDGTDQSVLAYAYEADLARLTPLGIRTRFGLSPIVAQRRIIVVGREDARHDFNQDGDADDDVPQVYDVDAAAARNMGLAGDEIWGVDGALLAFAVPESAQGNQDHNLDGDTDDRLVAFFDLDTPGGSIMIDPCLRARVGGGLVFMQLETTGIFVHDSLTSAFFDLGRPSPSAPSLADRRVAYGLDEFFDLNGDGDAVDRILFLFDARTGRSTSSELAIWPGVFGSALALGPQFCAFLSSAAENAPGGAARAGSSPSDAVAQVEDLQSGAVLSLEIPAVHLQLAGSLLALVVPEAQLGRDLNGDRDRGDWVIEVHDLEGEKTFSTGLAVRPEAAERFAFEQRTLVIPVSEAAQGRDLNGDQDLLDDVLHLVRVP